MSVTNSVENLVLEHLKAIRTDMASTKDSLKEITTRLGRLEVSVASLRRDNAHMDEAAAESGVRFDRLVERVERIEKRLELGS